VFNNACCAYKGMRVSLLFFGNWGGIEGGASLRLFLFLYRPAVHFCGSKVGCWLISCNAVRGWGFRGW